VSAPRPRSRKEDLARRGEEIFERDIRHRLGAARAEDFVLIDTDSGDYEIDAAEIRALHRLLSRRPDAQTWMRRIGSRSAYRLGSGRISAER